MTNRIARFLGSVAALLAVAVATPLLLVAASRARFGTANPLAGVTAPWHWNLNAVTHALSHPLDDESVTNLLLRVTLVVAWLAITTIVVTTVVEVVHLVRHDGLPMPKVRGVAWAQPFARLLASGLLVVVPLAGSQPAHSLGDHSGMTLATATAHATTVTPTESAQPNVGADHRSASTNDHSDARAGDQSADETPQARRESPDRHVVQRGESVYAIASMLAETSTLDVHQIADVILDANLGTTMSDGQRFTNPAYIEVGWELVIPRSVVPRNTTAPNESSPASVGERTPDNETVLHTVEIGDTLSEIAAEHLGDPNEWPQIFESNRSTVMNDGRVFDDPHLILPGWEIDVPVTTSTAPSDDVSVVTDGALPDNLEIELPATESSSTTTSDATTSDTARSDTAPSDTAPSADESLDAPELATSPTPSAPAAAPASTTTTSTAPAPAPASNNTVPAEPRPASSPIRMEHGALLAGGVLALVAARRHRRLRSARPRTRIPEPPASVVTTERKLRSIESAERSARVDVSLRAAAHELIGSTAQIGWVLDAPNGTIEILLTRPAHLAAPWQRADTTGQAWRLDGWVPIEMLADRSRQVGSPCVALVQIGKCGNSDVLIDLEACGWLSVIAPDQTADEVVTAMATALAVSPYAEPAHLVTASLSNDALLGHRNGYRVDDTDAAFELAAQLTGATVANDQSTFELRTLHTGGELWEPTVVLLTSDDTEQLSPSAMPVSTSGRGLALVAAGPNPPGEPGDRAELTAETDGWKLSAFGRTIDVVPVGISTQDLAALAELLAETERPLTDDGHSTAKSTAAELVWAPDTDDDVAPTPHDVSPQPDDVSPQPDDLSPQPDDDELAPFEPMPYDIMVKLLGGVTITASDGTQGSFERSKTVELIAYLATHRTRSTRAGARTALWEIDVRDATFANVVSEARRGLARLVTPPHDEEWVGRTLTEQLPLHPGVVTDAALIEERMNAARVQPPDQAIETLRPAVALVDGLPFAGTDYLWPDAEGIISNLILLATGVTTELAGHALSLGDIETVFWATGRGLRVLPGHEELVGLRMRAHAQAGDLVAVRQEWASYERVVVADTWSDGEPAPKLVALRHELLHPST